MTLFQYLPQISLFLGAVAMGVIAMGVIATVIRADEQSLTEVLKDSWFARTHEQARDTELLDFLEKSECNLFFNGTLGAWGLLDGDDKIVATAHSVRTTLARAIEKGRQEAIHG